jgi:predicted transcriptional regulator
MGQSKDALETYQQVVTITKDENIRQEATVRIEAIERSASRAKPPSLR